MTRPTSITIDLNALTHNFQQVKILSPYSSVISMVKANAYGHGLIKVAQALSPMTDALGVACLDEALVLRQAGIKTPILLIEGVYSQEEMQQANRYKLDFVIHQIEQLQWLQNTPFTYTPQIWLKINTGMNRLGIAIQDLEIFYQGLMAIDYIKKPLGLMTHFACADELDNPLTAAQIQLFEQATAHLPAIKSLANSAGILAWKQAHADWVRPGLMLYGASPFANKTGLDLGLKPVMTLKAALIAVYQIKKGQPVGYGATWQAEQDTLIGIASVGYGDGYPQATKGANVLVNGVPCQLAGRVSMDMLAINLQAYPQAKIGDEVVLWGQGLPVEHVAAHAQTSAYDVLTRLTGRVLV